MKHEQPTNAHPSHARAAGHPTPHRGGGQDLPSPRLDSRERSNDADGFSLAAALARLLPAVGVSLLSALGFLTVSAALSLRAPDPLALLTPLAWGSVGLSALLGGVTAGRRCPEGAVAAGLCTGAMVLLLVTLAGFLAGKADPSAWILRFCILPLSLVGALVARPKPKAAAHQAHGTGHRPRR